MHVGRQAIYDRSGDVVAYELLFRDAPTADHATSRGASATAQVIVSAFTSFGVGELVGDRPCFVNVTRDFVTGALPLPFDPGQIGLEILREVAVDEEVLAGVRMLAEQGYTITVDEFVGGDEREQLLPYASYVKIDMLHAEPARVQGLIEQCARYPHVQLIAQRLETQQQLDAAFELGFGLFQGNILGRPHVATKEVLAPGRLERLRLLAAISGTEVDLTEAAEAIERDPALTLRILHGVNATAVGLNRTVSSVFEAVVLLGVVQVRQWVTLMVVAGIAQGNEAQLADVLVRARMCQTVAEEWGQPSGSAYLAGLLSGVADMIDAPADQLAGQLPIDAEVADALSGALSGAPGPLASLVSAVRDYHRGEMAQPAGADLSAHLLAALAWTNAVLEPVKEELPHSSHRR